MGQYDEQLKAWAKKQKSADADYGLYVDSKSESRGNNYDSTSGYVDYVSFDENDSVTYNRDAFERAAEKQKEWWASTGSTHKSYGYDMTNPEDVQRSSEGRYSVAYEKSFGDDEYSQWLMKHGQASNGYFDTYYNEALQDIQLERNVRNFKKAVAREAWSTASDPMNITGDDIAAAAQRVQIKNPQYAGIAITNTKDSSDPDYSDYVSPMLAEQTAAEKDAEKRATSLYLDEVVDLVGTYQDRQQRDNQKAAEAAERNANEAKSIIDLAIQNSGYSEEINSRVGLAKDSTIDEWNANKELKRKAATDAVGAMEVAGMSKSEIKQAIRQDGRLSYIEDSEQGIQDETTRIQRRDASDAVVSDILMAESPIVQASVARAKSLGNMGTAAQAGFSPISMMEGYALSDTETAYVEKYMNDTRLALEMSGYDGLEIDNAFRRADLGEYIPKETARANYAVYTLNEMGCSNEQIEAILGSWGDEDWAAIDKDMSISDYVENSTIDIAGKATISVPIRAALSIISGAVGFADMVGGTISGRTEAWELTDKINEQAAWWSSYSHDRNHEIISEAADIGSEMLRMYATSMMGTGLAAASTKLMSTAKGTGFLFNFISKNASRFPFVAGAIGNYYTEAMNEGTTARQAAAYAIPAGLLEGYLESLEMGQVMKNTFGANFVGKKIAASGLSANFKQLAITKGMPFINFALDVIGEGVEESLSAIGSSILRTATWDEYHQLDMSDVWENAKGGLILGAVMGGLSMGANTQSHKYASEIYKNTGDYSKYIDSLQSAVYVENMDEAKRNTLVAKAENGEIAADREAAIDAEADIRNAEENIAAKKAAVEAAEEDAVIKIDAAKTKVKELEKRIATLRENNGIKKAKKISELSAQLSAAKKSLAQVESESQKKVATATADYQAIAAKSKKAIAKNQQTVDEYHAAKYVIDTQGENNAVSAPQTVEPNTNTTDTANVAQNPIDTVKEDTAEVVPEPALKDLGANSMGIVSPELRETTTAVKRGWRKFKQAFISSFAEGERFSKIQSKINKGSVTMEDSAQLLRNAGGTVDYIMEDDLVDLNRKSMGRESYAAVMTPPEGIDFDVAQDYLLNLHNIDRMSAAEARAVMANEDGSVRTSEQSKQIVREMEAKYPELANWNAKRRQWWNAFGKEWFVNSGLVSQADWGKWQKAFPNYVPTFRTKYDNGLSSSSIYSTTVDVHGKVKHLIGGTSEVVDIRDGFARYINSVVRATAKNDVVLNLYNFAQQHPNAAAPYAQILDAEGKVSDTVTPDGLADSLDTDAFNEVVKGRYILKGKVDGETVSMAVSKDIYEAVADLFGRTYNPGVETFMNIGKAITTPVKMGITTYNPFFAVRNFLRDTQTAYINDDSINPATFTKSLMDAAVDIRNNSEDFQRFKAYGGDRTGFYSSTAGFVESAGLNADESKIKKWFKQFGKGVSAAGEYTETLNRYATFKRYLDRNGRTDDNYRKAVQAAAEGTTNFSRSGAATKVADAWCLYLNANVQGLDKMARQFTSKDTALKSLGKTAGIAIASVIVKHLTGNDENEHYQNLSNYIKDNNFVIPNYFGEKDDSGYPTSFIVIPKSQGYGAIIAAFERTATMFDEDKEFGEAYDGYLDTLAGALPVNPSTPFSAYKQAIKNESWSGATIEPSRMESEPVTERYDSETSTIAINISELLNRMGVEFSPMKVQYVLEQKTGIVGDVVLPATYVQNYDNYGEEKQKYNVQSAAKSVADPFKNQFVKDPLYSNDIVGNFYDELDEMEQLSKQAKSDRQSAGIDTKSDAEKAYSRWSDMSWWLTDSYKQERAVMASEPNTPKRDEKIRAIRKERVDAVKAFMDNPDTYKIPK